MPLGSSAKIHVLKLHDVSTNDDGRQTRLMTNMGGADLGVFSISIEEYIIDCPLLTLASHLTRSPDNVLVIDANTPRHHRLARRETVLFTYYLAAEVPSLLYFTVRPDTAIHAHLLH